MDVGGQAETWTDIPGHARSGADIGAGENLGRLEGPRFWRRNAWVAFYAPTGGRLNDGTVRGSSVGVVVAASFSLCTLLDPLGEPLFTIYGFTGPDMVSRRARSGEIAAVIALV